MSNHLNFFIDGKWVAPVAPATLDVIDPSTEEAYTQISVGSKADVDQAVAAAKAAFPSFSQTSKAERLALLQAHPRSLQRALRGHRPGRQPGDGRADHLGARGAGLGRQGAYGIHDQGAGGIRILARSAARTMVVKEPIGVCALITPWNWPLNQIVCKVAPAIAAGCTVVLKPSEIAPISGIVFAEVMEAAGTPKGVFNMVNGTGPDVGQVMAGHPDVDMVSFTGSTRAGIIVAKTAADTVKRVAQELGGKSANIVLPDADFERRGAQGRQGLLRQ